MFITSKYNGYNRNGEQIAAGLFLILTQPKPSAKYPMRSETCHDCGLTEAAHNIPLSSEVQAISDKMHRIWMAIFKARTVENSEDSLDACEVILSAKHRVEGCRYFRPSMINYPIRAIVRHTSLSQLGQFMMGFARVHGERITLSGSYGSDGLPSNVSDAVYERGLELPQELREAWNNGGGWNSAGSEASAMRTWALKNLAELRK